MKQVLTAAAMLWMFATAPIAARAATYNFLEDEAEPQVNVAFTAKTAATGSLSVVFDYRDSKNFYTLDLTPQAAELRSVIGGVEHRLANTPQQWKPSSQITIKRRPWLMQVIIDRQVELTAYDATFDTGQIGSTASGGWSLKDARVQPVEDVYFADDFTRTADQEGGWKAVSGKWTQTASSEKISARNADMSANPFSYGGDATKGDAFAQVGRWFWDSYEAQVSVRPAARGVVGLAVYVQDAKNYLAFLWGDTQGNTPRQLVRVVDGEVTVLAKSEGAFLPRQWYRLAVRTSPGYVEAFIDGAPVLKARDDWFGQGSIALLAQDRSTANFDDVRVQSYPYYRQDFATATGGAWTADGGAWRAANSILTSSAAAGDGEVPRSFLTGRRDWNGYEMTADAKAGQTGACGLVAGYRDDKDYAVFRWAGAGSTLPYHGRQQLVRFYKGKTTIISDEPATVLSTAGGDGFARVTLRLNAGALTVSQGDEIIAQMADETLAEGKPGLWAEGAPAVAFRDVVVFFPPAPVAQKVAAKMEGDTLMAGWASPTGEWPPSLSTSGVEFWNTGQFFGDAWIEYPWRRVAYNRGKLEFALRAQRGDFASGTMVRCEGTGDDAVVVTLLQGAATLKQARFAWKDLIKSGAAPDPTDPAIPLRVDLEGRALLVSIGGKPVLSYLSTARDSAVPGTTFAARSSGFALRVKDLRAFSANRDDYTFTEAPTDWYAPQGNWSVTSRWPCTSDWSFFAGIGLNPVLWSKRTYSGDIVVEMYAHNQMDLPKETGYSAPGNLNITIGGDGKNPSSGYSFVIGGWDYTRNAIFKGSEIVAKNDAMGPRFPLPVNHNPLWHNRWAYIRAELRHIKKDGRDGVQVSLSMDDEPLLEYFDPAPLPAFKRGGRVAFWTVDGTIMIARAKIESAVVGPRTLPSGLIDAAATVPTITIPDTANRGRTLIPRALLSDGLPSAVVGSTQGSADRPDDPIWTVTNPTAGGLFGVQLVKPNEEPGKATPWHVTPDARLQMDLTLPPNVWVDLYVTIKGQRHLIVLTNNQNPDAQVKLLGAARNPIAQVGTALDEKGWEHIGFELGAALKKLYPDATSWDIEELSLGALHGDKYRWLGFGFGGNPLGTSYRLRGAQLFPG